MRNYAEMIYGFEKKVPTANGWKRYINLDNAASTPPFKSIIEKLSEEALWYSSVHRGSGYKSRYTTKLYEEARETVASFVGADLSNDVVIFTKNTTDSINKIRHYLNILPGKIVVFTGLEHHSNELPWLSTDHIRVGLKNGELDLEQLGHILNIYRGNIKLLAVNGASNVTGYLPPIYTLAEMVHYAGGKILIDGAQLVPHRPVEMLPYGDIRHLDFLTFSGHKMYAPFGSGVLIGPRTVFSQGPPSQVGGGTIKGIGPAGVIWNQPPEVEEAGSPNVLGALALAESCKILKNIGWNNLVKHETELVEFTLEKLKQIPEIIIYGLNNNNRIGVIGFNLKNWSHQQVADKLAENWGIGVRNGCFCARSYVHYLLSNEQSIRVKVIEQRAPSQSLPGIVRVSFGCYNSPEEISILFQALTQLNNQIES